MEHLEAAASEGRSVEEYWLVRKDGSRFWADTILTALHDDEGKLRGFSEVAEEKQHSLYPTPSKRHEPLEEALTPRETEVLGLLTTGQTNQQIAQTLTISKGTAKVHVERIIRKLGLSDRTQAAVRAIELGFTSLETRRQPYP